MWYIYLTQIVDIFFAIDIFVNMISAIQTEDFEIIDDRKEIVINYLQGWFLIDLFAILPFDEMMKLQGNGLIRFTRIGKLYKLVKITRLVRLLKVAKKKGNVMGRMGNIFKIS